MTDLDPPVLRRSLPASVREARLQFQRANEGNERILDELSAEHVRAYRAALAELETAHLLIADATDLDLAAATRPAAIWLVGGRCIALGAATLALLDAGHPNEVPALVRQLHEANRLLDAIILGGDALVERWLRNKWVSPGEAAKTTHARHRELREDMLRHGVLPPSEVIPDLERTYGHISEMSHNRYRHVKDTMSVESRLMPVGPHPDARVRAGVLLDVGEFITESVTVVGHGLANILGRDWLTERFHPTFRALQELHARSPLTRQLLRA
jgi:hypothetical protein